MPLEELRGYCKEVIKDYPKIESDIVELFTLCVSEIEEGGSESHEVELCLGDIEELIENYE